MLTCHQCGTLNRNDNSALENNVGSVVGASTHPVEIDSTV